MTRVAARLHGSAVGKSQGVGRLGQRGQNNSSHNRGVRDGSGAARESARAGKNDAPDRPGASGHRFGPDLTCSECGILWDVHQRDPKPCKTETLRDAFARRPSGDFEASSTSAATGEVTEED